MNSEVNLLLYMRCTQICILGLHVLTQQPGKVQWCHVVELLATRCAAVFIHIYRLEGY